MDHTCTCRPSESHSSFLWKKCGMMPSIAGWASVAFALQAWRKDINTFHGASRRQEVQTQFKVIEQGCCSLCLHGCVFVQVASIVSLWPGTCGRQEGVRVIDVGPLPYIGLHGSSGRGQPLCSCTWTMTSTLSSQEYLSTTLDTSWI